MNECDGPGPWVRRADDFRRRVAALEVEQAQYRYKAGIATYLEVVVAENASLSARLSAADIQVRRMIASIQLVKALGGGWGR